MEKLVKKIEEIVTKLNYYLYDVEYVEETDGFVLRILIENDSSIDIDDCVLVSRAVSEFLDQDDPFNDPYNLEVTSSGAERLLKTTDQIKRAVGKHIYIETFDQKMTGEFLSYKEGMFEIKQKNKRIMKINEIDVNLVRLAIVM